MKNFNGADLDKLPDLPFQLGLLRDAKNYQNWMIDAVKPFLGQRIFEVGSGIGNMSRWLPARERLILSDIDQDLILYLQKVINWHFGKNKKVSVLKVDLNSDWKNELVKENLDTIVSFNVLEHVQEDKNFFADLIYILKNSKSTLPKRIITVVPAHQFAYGAIDEYYGHYRRYSYNTLKKFKDELVPGAKFYCRHFNLFGLPGWFFCGRVLRKSEIDPMSVTCFEKICPWVRRIDDFLHEKMRLPLGQSIMSIITF